MERKLRVPLMWENRKHVKHKLRKRLDKEENEDLVAYM
jgi:hypothetical protein